MRKELAVVFILLIALVLSSCEVTAEYTVRRNYQPFGITWKSEMVGCDLYLTVHEDGTVELKVHDQELEEDVYDVFKGTWEQRGWISQKYKKSEVDAIEERNANSHSKSNVDHKPTRRTYIFMMPQELEPEMFYDIPTYKWIFTEKEGNSVATTKLDFDDINGLYLFNYINNCNLRKIDDTNCVYYPTTSTKMILYRGYWANPSPFSTLPWYPCNWDGRF